MCLYVNVSLFMIMRVPVIPQERELPGSLLVIRWSPWASPYLTLPHSLSFPDSHFRWCMEYLLFYLSCLFDLFCHRLRKDSLSDNKLCITLINIIFAKIFWVFSVSRTVQTCAWSYPSSFPFHFSFRIFYIDVVLGAIHCSLITVSVFVLCTFFFFFLPLATAHSLELNLSNFISIVTFV